MTDTTKQIASFDPGRVLQDQVAAWTKERDRLQELIDTASLAATPSPVPADTAELPPLPEKQVNVEVWEPEPCRPRQLQNATREAADDYYTADQMRERDAMWAEKLRQQERRNTILQTKVDHFKAIASRPAPVAEQKPFGYFHEMLDAYGKGNGVWLGCPSKDVTEKAYIEGEVGKEVIALYAAPVAAVPEGMALPLKHDATPSQPDQSAQEGGKDSGCRMTGGICACRSGGSFGGCAKERAYCCTNEPAAAPSAAQAAGVELDEQLHQFRSALEIIGVGDAPDPRRTAAETLVQAGFWKREALATSPSEGVAAPVEPAVVEAGEMTAERAAFFMRRFKGEEKLLGPNEQKAVAYVLALLESQAAAATAQPSADQVRDAALAECEAICNNVHDQYHAQRLIRELRASGEKGADRG